MTTIMHSIFVLLLVATGATLPTSVQGQVSVVGFRDALRTGVAPTVDRYSARNPRHQRRSCWYSVPRGVTQSQSAAMPLRTETIPPETVVVPQSVEMRGNHSSGSGVLSPNEQPRTREASAKVGVEGNAVQVGLPPNPTFFTSSPQWAGSISQYNWVLGQDYITAESWGSTTASYDPLSKRGSIHTHAVRGVDQHAQGLLRGGSGTATE